MLLGVCLLVCAGAAHAMVLSIQSPFASSVSVTRDMGVAVQVREWGLKERQLDLRLCLHFAPLASAVELPPPTACYVLIQPSDNSTEFYTEALRLAVNEDGWIQLTVTVQEPLGGDDANMVAISPTIAVAVVSGASAVHPGVSAVGFDWQLGGDMGWGTFGLHAALADSLLLPAVDVDVTGSVLQPPRFGPVSCGVTRGAAPPPSPCTLFIPLRHVHGGHLNPPTRSVAIDMLQWMTAAHPRPPDAPLHGAPHALLGFAGKGKPATVPMLVIHALGNDFLRGKFNNQTWGKNNVGMIFSELAANLSSPGLQKHLGMLDGLYAGSLWNAEVLQAAGLDVEVLHQGVDTALFRPMPPAKPTGSEDLFFVFSGGKLEYRKGQDMVIAAFKRFRARHPEAHLLAAWNNLWPHTAASIARSRHTTGTPLVDGKLEVEAWLLANGLERESFTLVRAAHERMPEVLAMADAALLPSRCEGGTNLVAMETLAMGLPTILSANSGHLDLLASLGDNVYPLLKQTRSLGLANVGWRDSDVSEMVARLEDVYGNREVARVKGLAAAAIMDRDWTWPRQMAKLLLSFERRGLHPA